MAFGLGSAVRFSWGLEPLFAYMVTRYSLVSLSFVPWCGGNFFVVVGAAMLNMVEGSIMCTLAALYEPLCTGLSV